MKKIVTAAVMASILVLSLTGCSNSLSSGGHTYEAYGLLNDEKASPKVCYETNVGDVILGLLFIETLIVPVYTFGFDYKEPKKVKDKDGNCN